MTVKHVPLGFLSQRRHQSPVQAVCFSDDLSLQSFITRIYHRNTRLSNRLRTSKLLYFFNRKQSLQETELWVFL